MLEPFKKTIFKKPIETLDFDMRLYCQSIWNENSGIFPDHLSDTAEKFKLCAESGAAPPGKDYPFYRSYIIDNRLRIIFATRTATPKVTLMIYDFLKATESFEDCAYGDGEKLDGLAGSPIPTPDNDAKYIRFAEEFNREYGFIPSEAFALPAFAAFDNIKLVLYRRVSPWQLCSLLQHYGRYNQVVL